MSLKTLSPVYRNKMEFVRRNLPKQGSRILDVGSGYGEYLSIFLSAGLKGYGIDIDKYALKSQKNVACSTAEELPFQSGVFDCVNCVDVLEHTENDKKALEEILRVLKPGGFLILTVPAYNFPFTYDPINAFLRLFKKKLPIGMWGWGHRRLYLEKDMIALAESMGFRIKKSERGSHAFICLFLNYIPFISAHLFSGTYRKAEKRSAGGTAGETGFISSVIYKVMNWLNNIDRKYFSGTAAVGLYFVLEKPESR